MAELTAGSKVKQGAREGVVVRRLPPNTPVGQEESESHLQATYEVDFGGEDSEFASAGSLTLLEAPAASEPASESSDAPEA